MARNDPLIVGLSLNGNRTVEHLGDHRVRIAAKERHGGGGVGGGGGIGGGGSVSFSTSNAGFGGGGAPLDLDVTGGTLAAEIPITAEPQVTKLGIGIASTDFLDMVSSGTDRAINSVHSIATTDVVTAGYRPWRLVMNNKTTDSGSGASIGLSVANYFGGSSSPVAAHGTTHAATFDTIVMGSDSTANEQCAVYMSLLDKTSDLAGSQSGRLWLTDTKVVGTLENYAGGGATPQQQILSGHNLLINKYQTASPVLSDAVGVVISTRPVSSSTIGTPQGSQTTVPVDVAFAITGVSGAYSPIGTGIGFTTAIRVGGNRTPWFPGSSPVAYGESHIGLGMEIADFDTGGIKIWRRWAGSTGKALSLGFDTAGVASTSFRDGINFGDDVHLYRGDVTTVACDGSLTVAGNLLNANVARVSAGGLTLGMSSQTGAYPIPVTEHGVFADATSAGFTVNPPAAPAPDGQTVTVIKTDASANAVTISRAGHTFDGAATKVLTGQYDSATMMFDGTSAWYSIGGGTASGTAGGHLTGTYPSPTISTTAEPRVAGLGVGMTAITGGVGVLSGTGFFSDGSQTYPISGAIGSGQPRLGVVNKNGTRALLLQQRFDNDFITQTASVSGSTPLTNRASDFGILYFCTATHATDASQEAQGTTGRYSTVYVGDSTELNAGGVNKYHYPGLNDWPAIGTVHAETRVLLLNNLGDRLGSAIDNEHTMARWVFGDNTSPASVTAGGVHSRAWFTDWTMNGAVDDGSTGSHRCEEFYGISMGLTYYNPLPPTDNPSMGMCIHTSTNVPKANTIHTEATAAGGIGTEPLDYGLCIRGFAQKPAAVGGTPAAIPRLGFRTGLCIGGTGMPFNQFTASLIGQAAEFLDWSTGGLKIWKRTAGSSGPAIHIGLDSTGADSTDFVDGIKFGSDISFYRGATSTLVCSDNFTVAGAVLNATTARVIMGGLSGPVTARTTGPYGVSAQERNVTADTTGGAFTINLTPSPVSGQECRITRINSGANDLTVDGNGKNIESGTSIVLSSQWESCFLYYDGTRWLTIAQPSSGSGSSEIDFLGLGQPANSTRLSFVAATNAAGGIDFGGDAGLFRSAAGVLRTNATFTVGSTLTPLTIINIPTGSGGANGWIGFGEQSADASAASADTGRLYAKDVGGKTALCARFSGASPIVTLAQQDGLPSFAVGAATALGGGATGLFLSNGGQMDTVNGAGAWLRNYAAVNAGSDYPAVQILFSGEYRMGAGGASAPDIGFVRAAANILKITDGSTSGGAGFRAGRIGLAIDPDVSIAKLIFPSTNAVADGISFGVDANRVTLYRSANDMLATDDSLHIATALGIGVAANSSQRILFPAGTTLADGIQWGTDVKLYRDTTARLRLDGGLHMATASLLMSSVTAGYVEQVSLTSAPGAPGLDGRGRVYFRNSKIVFQHRVSGTTRYVTIDFSADGNAITTTSTTAP